MSRPRENGVFQACPRCALLRRPGQSRALPEYGCTFLVLRRIWWMGMIAVRLRGDVLETGGCASIRPPPRGGCRPGKTVARVHIRSGWEGRRGEYCGWPSWHASAWSIRKGLDLFVVGIELRLVATASRSTPPVAAPSACLLPVMDIPSMAAPPLSEGGVSCRLPCALHSWDSRGGSTIIPEEPSYSVASRNFPHHMGRAEARPGRSPRGGTRFRASALGKRQRGSRNTVPVLGGPRFVAAARTGCSCHVPEADQIRIFPGGRGLRRQTRSARRHGDTERFWMERLLEEPSHPENAGQTLDGTFLEA